MNIVKTKESSYHLHIIYPKKIKGYEMESFMKIYKHADEEKLSTGERCKEFMRKTCSIKNCNIKRKVTKVLPILKIFKKYNVKTYLLNDVISGITVGIMQLPQGMAYAMLADLPPVIGLYVSFFPVLMYILLGSSRHTTVAIICRFMDWSISFVFILKGTGVTTSLMIGTIVSKVSSMSEMSIVSTNASSTITDPFVNLTTTAQNQSSIMSTVIDLNRQKVAVVSAVCFLVGATQVVFGLFRLGFVTSYMSDPLISAFTTGIGVHASVAQFKVLLGLEIPKYPNFLQAVYVCRDIVMDIPKTNISTLITSASCIIILYLVKEQINERFQRKLKIPIPIDLILVIIASTLSYFLKFNHAYQMEVVGKLSSGLPSFSLPPVTENIGFLGDAVIIAVVAFTHSVTLETFIANKQRYSIDSNQEFIAHGAGNLLGSFFMCFPCVASISRMSVQESSGGKTQITGLISALTVLLIILFIAPLFEDLPKCVLASIVVVAMRKTICQIFNLKRLWMASIYDFLIWIVTFISVVFLYIDIGLLFGLVFSFLTIVVRTQLTKPVIIQKVHNLDMYVDKKKFRHTEPHHGILIVTFNAPVYYANANNFVSQISRVTKINPGKSRKQMQQLSACSSLKKSDANGNCCQPLHVIDQNPSRNGYVDSFFEHFGLFSYRQNHLRHKDKKDPRYLHHLIIDGSSISYVDTAGSKAIKRLFDEYKSVGIDVFLVRVQENVWSALKNTDVLDEYRDNIYLTISDAVNAAADDSSDDLEHGITTYM